MGLTARRYANKEIEILESMHKQIAEQGVLKNSAYADAFKVRDLGSF